MLPENLSIQLEINTAIATIRRKEDLLKVVIEKIKPLFGFYDTGVLLLNKPKTHYYDLSVLHPGIDNSEANLFLYQKAYYQTLKMPLEGSVVEGILGELGQRNKPYVFNYEADYSSYSDYILLEDLKQQGYKEGLVALLKTGDEVLGCFFLNSLQKGFFQPGQFTLFQAITNQLSVAVANILANEEILNREWEKATLLSISEAMATIRERKELFATIIEKIKLLIPIDDTAIIVLDKTGKYWQDWTNVDNYQETEAANRLKEMGHDQFLPMDPLTEYCLTHTGIITLADTIAQYPNHPFLPVLREAGLMEYIYTPLVYGGQKLGILFLDSKKEGTYTTAHLSLIKTIGSQIAVAVANILANEEILEREREKAILLSIAEQIATVRDKDALFRLVFEKLKPIFLFDDAVIAVTHPDSTHSAFLFQVREETKRHPRFHDAASYRFPIQDGVADQTFARSEPWIYQVSEMAAKHPRAEYLCFIQEVGIREVMAAPLCYQSKPIGLLLLQAVSEHTFSPDLFGLFKSVADQIAAALSNILANEEILEREREKATLLSISETLATIRDRQSLFEVIAFHIQPLFNFDVMAINYRLKESDCHQMLVSTADIPLQQSRNHNTHFNEPALNEGTPMEELFAGTPELVITMEEFLTRYPKYIGTRICQEAGVKYSRGIALHFGGEIIGSLWLHYINQEKASQDSNQYSLVKSAADQLAVAVANILANEEVLEQKAATLKREEEKTLQIEITDVLTQVKDWEHKLLKTAKIFQPHIPFDYIIIGLSNKAEPNRAYSFYKIGFEEYQTIRTEDFLRMKSLTPEKLKEHIDEIRYTDPLILNGESFADFCRKYRLKAFIADTFKLASNLVFPFELSREGTFLISFYSKQSETYGQEHLDLLQKMHDSLTLTVDRLLAFEEIEHLSEKLKEENIYLAEEVNKHANFQEIVGNSPALHEVLNKVALVASVDSTVMIGGETGTGKELVARAIHSFSRRSGKIMVKVNCASLPAQLIESELFGHEKGAFTGAIEKRIGKFELANGGTIFLDEIGEVPLELQAKLLRVLQEKEIERLGGKGPIKVDVRVIVASNRNLQQEVALGRFRADLYYRLNVFPIVLPPLRERKEDIPLLASYFLQRFNKKMGKRLLGICHEALKQMSVYSWPGNIRELEHVVEQSVITSRGKVLELARPLKLNEATIFPLENSDGLSLKTLADHERDYILKVLKLTNGRIRGAGGAAEILNIIPTTLESRMKKLGIRKEHVAVKDL